MKKDCIVFDPDNHMEGSLKLEPHIIVDPSEYPTEAEILKREEQDKKLEHLGIEVDILDGYDDPENYEEDTDKLRALILIRQDKEIPKDLKERLLKKKKKAAKKQKKAANK